MRLKIGQGSETSSQGTQTSQGPENSQAITWDRPGTWHKEPDPGQFSLAAFNVVDEYGASRVTVTRLSGDGGGALPNINRWRGQVNLPPVSSLTEQDALKVRIAGTDAAFLDLFDNDSSEPNPARILVVLFPRGSNETWFFKMSGQKNTIDAHKPSFLEFLESIRFEEASR